MPMILTLKREMKFIWQNNHRFIFYTGWLLLSFLQAYLTGLQDDEAYYWVYSKFLSWGYFDHPPMIALLIKTGTLILPGELGVRFMIVILSTLTLLITEKLIETKNYLLFYSICLSLPILQVSGFMAVPDIPLIFFTSLFFLVYRSFIKKNSIINTISLGLVMTGLLYSKYHGVLIIFFTLLSNIKLLRSAAIYVSGIIAVLLFTPHLIWQYDHDWISFKFHFFERSAEYYDLRITIEYVLGQFLLVGPIAGIIFFTGTFLYRTKNSFERSLKYTAVGIFSFFLLSTFKGRVEANWTSPVLIPMIVLTHNYLLKHERWKIWLYKLLPLSVALVLVIRFFMIADVLPIDAVVERFHAWKRWPLVLKNKTKDLPVVFKNSYQRASQYWFHTGQIAYSLNDYRERMNNYNIWPIEDSLLGKKVYIMDIYRLNSFKDSMQARLWTVGFSPDSNFQSFAKLLIKCEPNNYILNRGEKLTLDLIADIPGHYRNYLLHQQKTDEQIIIGVFKGKQRIKEVNLNLTLLQLVRNPRQQVVIYPDIQKGRYSLVFAIRSSTGLFTQNSERIGIIIK